MPDPPSPATPHPWRRVPAPLRRPYEYWIYLCSLGLFVFGGLFFSAIAFALSLVLPDETGKRLGRRMLSGLFRFFHWALHRWGLVSIDLQDIDDLRELRGAVVAPNHITLFDVVFIVSRLPDAVCIAKASVMRNPVYGGFARLCRYIPNDSPAAMVKAAQAELESGAVLLVFPEGTRTVDPPINRFKGGFALIAKRARAPIHTLYITSNSHALGKRWFILKAPKFPYRYRIERGATFEVAPEQDTKAFLDQLETHFRDALPEDPRTTCRTR